MTLNLDHTALWLKGHDGVFGRKTNRFFKYEITWGKEKGYKEVVKQVWRRKFFHEDRWHNLKGKLDSCSKGILRWRKKEVGLSASEIKEKTALLMSLHGEEGSHVLSNIHMLQRELNFPLDKEDGKWKQRSKETWLKKGNRNTKYFHAWANQRRRKNYIG